MGHFSFGASSIQLIVFDTHGILSQAPDGIYLAINIISGKKWPSSSSRSSLNIPSLNMSQRFTKPLPVVLFNVLFAGTALRECDYNTINIIHWAWPSPSSLIACLHLDVLPSCVCGGSDCVHSVLDCRHFPCYNMLYHCYITPLMNALCPIVAILLHLMNALFSSQSAQTGRMLKRWETFYI